jgi:hypothetical protein
LLREEKRIKREKKIKGNGVPDVLNLAALSGQGSM